jgi:hypothetical protein
MEEGFRIGEPVFIDPIDAPPALRGLADRVRRDDGGETVDLDGLGQVPRAWVHAEQRSNRKRPWAESQPETLSSSQRSGVTPGP